VPSWLSLLTSAAATGLDAAARSPAAAAAPARNEVAAVSVCLRWVSSVLRSAVTTASIPVRRALGARLSAPWALCQAKVSARSVISCCMNTWVGVPMSLLIVSASRLAMAPPTVLAAA
jgi:hypothetical protein